MISSESNQSSCWPRSSMSWKLPMAMASRTKPSMSNGRRPVVRGVAHQHQDAGGAQQADRQVDVEHPAPGELVGQPAAQRRADDRTDHGADAPHRHRLALLLARIGVHHDGLRDRHQRGAKAALQGAEQHELVERLGRAAQHRHDGEADHAGRQRAAQAEARGAEARERRHDGRGHDVGGHHPGDLLLRRRQRALDRGQRHVGDGAVEGVHDGGHHHHDGDQAAPAPHRRIDRRHGLAVADALDRPKVLASPLKQAADRAAVAGVDLDRRAHADAQAADRLRGR